MDSVSTINFALLCPCVCVCVFINKINRWQPRVSMTEAASLASLYIAKAITERSREGLKARRQGDRQRERERERERERGRGRR